MDHAISIAGVMEQGNIFDSSLTIESVQEVRSGLKCRASFPRLDLHLKSLRANRHLQPDPSRVLDINLIGVMYFTRIATAYLHHNAESTDAKSITLLGSTISLFVHGGNYTAYAV